MISPTRPIIGLDETQPTNQSYTTLQLIFKGRIGRGVVEAPKVVARMEDISWIIESIRSQRLQLQNGIAAAATAAANTANAATAAAPARSAALHSKEENAFALSCFDPFLAFLSEKKKPKLYSKFEQLCKDRAFWSTLQHVLLLLLQNNCQRCFVAHPPGP